MRDCSFEISDTIARDDEIALEQGLTAHAFAQKSPPYEEKPLSIIRRDADGKIVAGLTGKTFWNWMYVDIIWVDDALRGTGIGSAMMETAEQEAKKRGCHSSYVWTESFQAPDFYAKLGYNEFVRMDDFPVGHQRFGFMKRLGGQTT